MKRIFLLLLTTLAFTQAQAADVGVSISVGEPGFYGQIEIGDFVPQPRIIYAQPVIIQPVPVHERPAPVYLHVPPGQAKKWSRYCGQYDACGHPVYFVKDSWYNDVYVPKYKEHRERGGHGNEGHDNDRHDNDRHDDRGDHGNGHGHDKH